jgi:hypothetical protein
MREFQADNAQAASTDFATPFQSRKAVPASADENPSRRSKPPEASRIQRLAFIIIELRTCNDTPILVSSTIHIHA